ncbi:MAG: DUF4199 domain-containing protein [Bacteroidia bacterium]
MSSQLKYGVLSGLVLGVVLFLTMFMQPAEIDMNNPFAGANASGGILLWFFKTGVLFTLFFLAAKEVRDNQLGGYISFGKAFGVSYVTGLYTILVYVIVAAIYYYVFNPDWFPMNWDQFAETMEENANGQDIEQSLKFMKMWFDNITLITLGGIAIGNLIGMAILSLVIGGVVQKDDPDHVNL